MACCLTAPIHSLRQCWLTIHELWGIHMTTILHKRWLSLAYAYTNVITYSGLHGMAPLDTSKWTYNSSSGKSRLQMTLRNKIVGDMHLAKHVCRVDVLQNTVSYSPLLYCLNYNHVEVGYFSHTIPWTCDHELFTSDHVSSNIIDAQMFHIAHTF